MKLNVFYLFWIAFFTTNLFAQTTDLPKSVEWKNFDEVSQLFAKDQRPVFIYLYDTNPFCKMMTDSTLGNQEVVNYLNIAFYNIKFDVASKEEVKFFDGNTYYKDDYKKYHDLINNIIGEEIELPALLIYSRDAQGQVFYNYRDRDHIFPILIYYNEEIYKSTTYEEFEKRYFEAYPIGMQQIITRLNLKWLPFNEMLELQKEKPKKVLIDIYYNYSIAATMMRTKTYNDPIISKYLNENYYLTTVDAKTTDEITIKGITYKNQNAAHGFHDFPIDILSGNIRFPAFVILDEEFNLLDRVQIYLTPEAIEPIFRYYGDDKYKTQKYDEYMKNFTSSFKTETKN